MIQKENKKFRKKFIVTEYAALITFGIAKSGPLSACENARMVNLIWVLTCYTSVTHLRMRIKYLLHEWPNKTNVILSRFAISPEHLTAHRQIALIACASNLLNMCNPLPSV